MGLLALDPIEFKINDTRTYIADIEIKRMPFFFFREPYTITNRGLEFSFVLSVQDFEEIQKDLGIEYLMLLNCFKNVQYHNQPPTRSALAIPVLLRPSFGGRAIEAFKIGDCASGCLHPRWQEFWEIWESKSYLLDPLHDEDWNVDFDLDNDDRVVIGRAVEGPSKTVKVYF